MAPLLVSTLFRTKRFTIDSEHIKKKVDHVAGIVKMIADLDPEAKVSRRILNDHL